MCAGSNPAEGTSVFLPTRLAVTGLANLAVKVLDLDAACVFYEEFGVIVRRLTLVICVIDWP